MEKSYLNLSQLQVIKQSRHYSSEEILGTARKTVNNTSGFQANMGSIIHLFKSGLV